MLKYLLEKEFKQFMRNPFLPKLIVFMPVMILLILPWAADLNTKNVNLVVVNHDRSPFSARLVGKATAADYFILSGTADSYDEAMRFVESGRADIILEIPHGFERDLVRFGHSQVLVAANTVNSAKGSLGSSYLARITDGFAAELTAESGLAAAIGTRTEKFEAIPDIRYNPSMDYRKYMVPAFMVALITMFCGFLPALNIVLEKENGTIEQINVTPIKKIVFILAKLIPYWIIGVAVLTLGLVIAWLVYGIVPAGNLLTIYAGFAIYVIAVSGLGIVVSNYSSTLQQAMLVMFFFMIIFILMSGMFTPISSMPEWAQKITILNPMRYFVRVMRSTVFRGSGIADLSGEFIALACFGVAANAWAVLSYRKSG